MARIKIEDLPKDLRARPEEMRKVSGGVPKTGPVGLTVHFGMDPLGIPYVGPVRNDPLTVPATNPVG